MSLDRVRADIDAIDERLVGLLAERESLVREAATYKTSERSVRAPDRVEQVLAKVRAAAKRHDASEAVVVAVYRAMIGAFIELELTERAGLEPTDGGGADEPSPEPDPPVPPRTPRGTGSTVRASWSSQAPLRRGSPSARESAP